VQGVLKKAGTYLSTISNGKYFRSTGVYAVASDRDGGDSYKEVRKKYKKSRGQGTYWDTAREPVREAVIVGYNENAATGDAEYAAERLIRNNKSVDKAVEALRSAGFTVTPMEGEEYRFLVTKKAKPSPDAETQTAPSSLDDLGIDFQSATMDASGTRLPTPGAFTGKFQDIMKGAKSWKEVQERLKGQTVTYFDFETTGIADYDGQDITNDPVQLGAVQVKDGKIVKRFNVYINPESKLSEWSAKNLGRDILDENGNRILDENGKPTTTPVTPEWLAEQASQEQALKDFIEFIGPNALLGGQNVPFDIEILKRMADKSGIDLDIAGTIDSKDLASLLPKYDAEKGIDGPKAPDRKTGEIKATSSLGPVANFLGFEPANWHSADGDAEDSYNLVSKIIDRAANEDNQDLNLLDFPAMQKRYEERMAEFKDVVSPNSPTTDNQKKALEEFSNSDNPEIAAKAKDALASAATRGEAAEALNNLHMLENQKPSETFTEELGAARPEPSSQKLVMPEPEEGRSKKTVEASTLFKKIKSLKESIADGEDLQNYLKSRGREEDPDMAKLLDRQYRELRGLEFVEAYRKQTGKDRVSAPYSVLDGTDKIFDSVDKPQTESLSSNKEAAPAKSKNQPLDIDLSDFSFDDPEENVASGPLDTPQAIAASALALANSTGLGMRKGKANDRVISAEPSGTADSPDGSIKGDRPSQQAIDTKDQVVALGESLLTLAEQSILDKLVESGTIPEGTTPESLNRMIEEFTNKRDEMSDSLIEGRKNFNSKLSQVVATALNGLSDEQIAKIKEEALRVLEKGAVEALERGESLDTPMRLLIDSSYKSWFPKFDTGDGYEYGIDGKFSTYDFDNTGTYRDFFGWIAIKEGLVDISELEAEAERLKESDNKLKSAPRPESVMKVYQEELAKSIHDRLKETGIEFDSVPLESLFAGYMPKARRYSKISKKTQKELEAALQFIPKDILESAADWLETVHKNNVKDGNAKIRLISSSTRAKFGWETTTTGGTKHAFSIKGGGVSDYLHEIWHFIQEVNPNIGVLENAHTYGRVADSNGNLQGKMDIYGDNNEIGISQTGIVDPYTTRQYIDSGSGNKRFSAKNLHTEVMTTLVEDLFTEPGFYSTPRGITAVVGKGKNRKLYKNPHMDIATGIWYTDKTMKTRITPTAFYGRKISDGVDRDLKSFGIGMILTLAGLKNSGK
jgi:DNA polymerase III epsilon subunit-like protein